MTTDPLREYRDKRDLDSSPEPPGDAVEPSAPPVFVVQHHEASTEHWDLRLEVDGVLVSWAVPKGPSRDPDEQRLAVRTEDHPLEYADFEGRIPKSEYGGGDVIVWDLGAYRILASDDEGEAVGMAEALDAGHAHVWLEGGKLRGGYTLTHARIGGDDRNWLLAKVRDEGADARRNPVRTEPESVLSDRTVGEVAAEAE